MRLTVHNSVKLVLFVLMILLFSVCKAQTSIGLIKQNRYLVINSLPNTNKITLSGTDSYAQGTIVLYNIFFENDAARYLLVVSLLPDRGSKHVSLCSNPIAKNEFEEHSITYSELEALVTSTISIMQEQQESGFVLPHILYSRHIVPVWLSEEGDYYPFNNQSYSELFVLEDEKVPFEKKDIFTTDYKKLTDEVLPYFQPNVININNPMLPYSSLADVNIEIATHYAGTDGRKIPSRKEALQNPLFNNFKGMMLLQGNITDSIYHFFYYPNFPLHNDIDYSLRDIYFHPRVGVVGASFEDYFYSFYYWIPNAQRTGKFIYSDSRFLD